MRICEVWGPRLCPDGGEVVRPTSMKYRVRTLQAISPSADPLAIFDVLASIKKKGKWNGPPFCAQYTGPLTGEGTGDTMLDESEEER
jgi:hypothetical protein